MVELPRPLPSDVDSLRELVEDLKRDIVVFRGRIEQMERLVEQVEALLEREQRRSGVAG